VCLASVLYYNSAVDVIDGFVDTGVYKTEEFADHALIFIVRGIKKKFKQLISYTFC